MFSRKAERCILSRVNGCSSGETCRDREKSGIVECTESEPWSNHEKEVTGKLVASRNSENSLNSKAGSRKLATSFSCVTSSFFTWRRSTRSYDKFTNEVQTDDLNDFDENNAIRGIFMHATLQAAVHLGESTIYQESTPEVCEQLFQVTETLINDQTEISGLTKSDCKHPTWRSTTLVCDKAIEITNAKTYVFSDSVPCLGSISDQPVEAWKNKIKWYLETRSKI